MKEYKTVNIEKDLHAKLKNLANINGMMICKMLGKILIDYFSKSIKKDLTK